MAPRPAPILLLAIGMIVLGTIALGGCSSGADRNLRELMARGQYARAAARVESTMERDRASRDYMLDRMRLGIARLADGHPDTAEEPLLEVFDTLRTQGINDDKTVAAAVLGEGGVIFWKGEPFEQALAYSYIAIQRAQRGEWDNARAASLSSLFLLKDFGENEQGARKSTEDIAREAARRDSASESDDYLDKGYTPIKTNFALGYLLAGASNLALAQGDPAREDEARDHFREAFTLNPALKPIADALITRRANALIVVDLGLGPRKAPYGPDDALARYTPATPSDSRLLEVRLGDAMPVAVAAACDVNRMSADHMWNNFEDVRIAKSTIGQGLMVGGAVTAAASRNDTGRLVGLGLLVGGLLTRGSAAADTRHCEALAQRTYVAAVAIPRQGADAELQILGDLDSRLSLPGLRPPDADQTLVMYYARLPASASATLWSSDGQVRYANDSFSGPVPGDTLPYILGGRCVRRPSADSLARYQEAGNLTGMTLAELEELFRLEGIEIGARPPIGPEGMHLLEGGRWLGAPVAGSAGFVRVFCLEHAPYSPRSREVSALAARMDVGGVRRASTAESSITPKLSNAE